MSQCSTIFDDSYIRIDDYINMTKKQSPSITLTWMDQMKQCYDGVAKMMVN